MHLSNHLLCIGLLRDLRLRALLFSFPSPSLFMKLRHEFSTTNASWHSGAQLCFLMEFLLKQTHTALSLWNSAASEHGVTEGWRRLRTRDYYLLKRPWAARTCVPSPNSCSNSEQCLSCLSRHWGVRRDIREEWQARDCVQNTVCLFCLSFSKMEMKDSSSCVLFCFHCHFLSFQERCLL